MNISVREIQIKDVDLIVAYWLESDLDHLTSMGVDLNKLPTRKQLSTLLTEQIKTSLVDKQSYALIWVLNGKPVGHSNVNGIHFAKKATMHLHLWNSTTRKQGMRTEFVKQSLPFYFDNLKLEKLICEPYALNLAPNKTLKRIGFEFIKTHKTIPGSLNFEQNVNRWELTRANYELNTL